MKHRFLRFVAAFVAMSLMSVTLAHAATFDDLTGYQKQKYWVYINDCIPLMSTQPAAYQSCALDAFNKAYNTSESGAWCISSNNNTPDYFKKDIVKTDINPNGREDYVYTFSNGISYVMEGFCNAKKQYSYYQKNCAEFGPLYYADKNLGACVAPPVKVNQPPVVGAVADQYILVGKTLSFKVVATDPDNDPIVGYTAGNLPAGASFDKITGTFTFTPTAQSGDLKFTVPFTATDGKATSATTNVNIFVSSKPGTPTFTFYETDTSPMSASASTTVTKEFMLSNTDKVRYIVLALAAGTEGNPLKKYIPSSWITFPMGTLYKLDPNTSIKVQIVINIPAGISPEKYTTFLTATMQDYGGSVCNSGCNSSAIGLNSTLNILP